MKIVIAPDSYKESLDAMAVANCIQNGFSTIFPDAEYIKLPLADGGEGTVEALLQGMGGERKVTQVCGPLGEAVETYWALLEDGKTAAIEIAAASGLMLLRAEQRDPDVTTSFGTGQLIKQALDAGVNKIIIGLGGSATNDGGGGIMQALGARLLDKAGKELAFGGAALSQLAYIDYSAVHPRARDVEVVIACDVNNPLCGSKGASAIFGRQKGGKPEQLTQLDWALGHFAKIAAEQGGADRSDCPGFGAAGGAPLGLSLIFNIQMRPGIELVLDTLKADELLSGADLVITGEGQVDNQTLHGKTPLGIARLAEQKQLPVIAIAGSLGQEIDELYPTFSAIFATVRAAQTLETVLSEAEANLTKVSANIARTLKLGSQLSGSINS